MKNDLLKFFDIQRMIFGICSNCNEFFRLSDCKLFLKTKPSKDWKDELDAEADLLEALAEKLDERKKYLQELAREKNRFVPVRHFVASFVCGSVRIHLVLELNRILHRNTHSQALFW
jgi:hypothetical protein